MIKVGKVRYNREAPSGNIFSIMGGASKILRHCGMKEKAEEMTARVTSSGSYEDALKIIGEYVNLEEQKLEEGELIIY